MVWDPTRTKQQEEAERKGGHPTGCAVREKKLNKRSEEIESPLPSLGINENVKVVGRSARW